jgi:ubiquinone/menaquinone biosynthesis C-methylase UbiE
MLTSLAEQYESEKVHYKVPAWYTFFMRFGKNRLEKVESLLPKGKKVDVLDIACGDGAFLKASEHHWRSVLGLDISPNLIKRAKKQSLSVPAKFAVHDCGTGRLPLKDSSVQFVTCLASLQYIFDLEQFISEVHRVLKKNGTYIFTVPNAVYLLRRLTWLSGNMPSSSCYTNGYDAGTLHYFVIPRLTKFLEENGFVVEKVVCSGVFDEARSLWPSMLGADSIFVCRKR